MTLMTEFYILAVLALGSSICAVFARSTLTAALFHTQSMMTLGGILVLFHSLYVGFSLFALSCTSFVVYLLFGLLLSKPLSDEKRKTSFFVRLFLTLILWATGHLCWLLRHVKESVFLTTIVPEFSFGKAMFSNDLKLVLIMGAVFFTASVGIGVSLMASDNEKISFLSENGEGK